MRKVQKVNGSSFRRPPILEHIVLVVKGEDNHAGTEEEEGLEKGMRHKMKNRCRPCADAKRKEHISDLADGGIGKDPL